MLGLRNITIKKYNHTKTLTKDNIKEYPNLLKQNFFTNKPGLKCGSDITYIYTKETR